jgi:hypothetical protein
MIDFPWGRGSSNDSGAEPTDEHLDVAVVCEFQDGILAVYDDYVAITRVDRSNFENREIPVEEAIIEECIAHKFGLYEYRAELDPDISRDTVVIYEDIPIEYLSIDASESVIRELSETLSEPVAKGVGLD